MSRLGRSLKSARNSWGWSKSRHGSWVTSHSGRVLLSGWQRCSGHSALSQSWLLFELAWTCPSLVIYTHVCVWCVCEHALSVGSTHLQSYALWTVARQAPLSIGFPRQDYWGRVSSSGGSSPPRDSNPHLLRLLHCRRTFFFFSIAKLPWKPLELLGYISSILSELPA